MPGRGYGLDFPGAFRAQGPFEFHALLCVCGLIDMFDVFDRRIIGTAALARGQFQARQHRSALDEPPFIALVNDLDAVMGAGVGATGKQIQG